MKPASCLSVDLIGQFIDIFQESPSSWLDSALSHISEIIQLEDVPSIQMEVAVLVREFPDIRYYTNAATKDFMNANINVDTTLNTIICYC